MKKLLPIFLLLMISLSGYGQLRKTWTLKVDPSSGLFHEFRASYEHRFLRSNTRFYTLQPGLYLRNIPGQKRYGVTLRSGIRQYFFTDYAPHGMFLYLGLAYRGTRINYHDTDLEISSRAWLQQPGATFTIGHQWLFRPRKDFVFSLQAGPEFLLPLRGKNFSEGTYKKAWYEPLYGTIPILEGLRIYASAEIGFAFRQKNRHNRRWMND